MSFPNTRGGLRPGPFAPVRVYTTAAGYGGAKKFADGGGVDAMDDTSYADPSKQAYYDSLHSAAINSIIQGGLRGFAAGGGVGVDPISGLGGGSPGTGATGPGPGSGGQNNSSSQNGGMDGGASPSNGPTAGGIGGFVGGVVGGLLGGSLGPVGSLGMGALGRAGGRSLGEAIAKAFSPDPEDQSLAPTVDQNVSEVGQVGPGSGQVGIGDSEGNGGMDGSGPGPAGAASTGTAAASTGDASAGTGESSGGTGGTGADGAGGYAGGGIAGGGGFNGIHQPQTRGVGGNRSVPTGLVQSHTPGRADAVTTKVPHGTYIIPADVTSIMGQGNTLAGKQKLDGHFATATAHNGFSSGGMVDVRLSGGEYRVPAEKVAGIGGGSLERGRQILDGHVHRIRAEEAHRLRTAPGPRQ